MKVTLERLPESRVQLDIEVDDERLEKSLDSAYKRLAQKARIPGFRPGKAPRHMIERAYGREGLIREALDYVYSLGFTLTGLQPGVTDPRNGRLLQADGIFFREDG